jgi:hypothetical protein
VNPATTLITVIDATTQLPIQNARVIVQPSDGTGDLPFEDSVTITRILTDAYVVHNGHGLKTGDKVIISGANQPEYNGLKEIVLEDGDTYSYTVSGSPATPATGTITSTALLLEGLTDSNGQISDIRAHTTDQPIIGWVRKSSSSPYYKTGPFSGIVDTVAGYSQTVQLILDQ